MDLDAYEREGRHIYAELARTVAAIIEKVAAGLSDYRLHSEYCRMCPPRQMHVDVSACGEGRQIRPIGGDQFVGIDALGLPVNSSDPDLKSQCHQKSALAGEFSLVSSLPRHMERARRFVNRPFNIEPLAAEPRERRPVECQTFSTGGARGCTEITATQIAIDMPPSATSTRPVTKDDASDDRNTAAPANSSAFPQRFIGVRLRIQLNRTGSDRKSSLISVAM